MSDHPYIVKLRGRDHATFVYARDADRYVHSDAAKGPSIASGGWLYSADDYTIEEAASGRKVVGTTGHGHAILERLRKARP